MVYLDTTSYIFFIAHRISFSICSVTLDFRSGKSVDMIHSLYHINADYILQVLQKLQKSSLHKLLLHHIIPILSIVKKSSNFYNQIIRIIIYYHIVNNIIIYINAVISISAFADRMIWFKSFCYWKSLHNSSFPLI